MTSFWPVLDRFHEQPHTHNQIHFWTLHPREVLPRHEDPHRSRPQTLSNPVQIILHFHISLTQMQRKKKFFITIPTIEPSHYRWHPTTKRTGFSRSISPCQKILFRNHHSKYFQNPPPLPWHPSPQNPQGIKFQNSPPNCDATLTRRKKLLQVSTRLLAYIIENDTTAQHLTQPPHPYLPQNRIPQGHLSTFLPSQTNISTFCSPWILSVIATDTLAINMQAYASQLHLPTGTDLLIKVT